MPIVRIEIFEGRSVEKKRQLVRAVTTEVVKVLECGEASVNVIIDEINTENWAAGGELYKDKLG